MIRFLRLRFPPSLQPSTNRRSFADERRVTLRPFSVSFLLLFLQNCSRILSFPTLSKTYGKNLAKPDQNELI